MESVNFEKKLLRYVYLLVTVGFLNLFLIKRPFDIGALIIGAVLIVLFTYTHFIIRKFFPEGDKFIFILACALVSIGMIMLYRLDKGFAIKQIIWVVAGITAFIFIIVLLPKLSKFKKFKVYFLVLSLIFMAMATFFGREVFGAKNWVFIGGFGFQPSEIGKVFLTLYLAAALEKYDNSVKSLIEPAVVVMLCLGFMVFQRDLGTALMIFGISVTMLYIASSKLRYVLTCLVLFFVGGTMSYFLFNHVKQRIMIWMDPWPYVYDDSYQVVQSLYGIASGGLFGNGLGLGHPEFVSVKESDFIFSAISEEMGLLMGIAILIIYFLLFYRSIRGAIYTEDTYTKLVDVGFSAMIATQVLVIVGGVTNAIPLTGITMPLVSYGGTSMLTVFIILGILQKISEGEK
ncbi:MAG: FtsW/RodA/SpoVE family cell cycle protein [Clostridiaceae bacterium]